jgi:transposase
MLEGMIYILRTGVPWRDLPWIFGSWNSVYTRWRRWCQCGLWGKVLLVLALKAKGVLRFLDASHVKVHQDASNPAGGQQNQAMGRTKGGLNTKVSAWVDGFGRAVWLTLAAGQRADVKVAQESWPKLNGHITVADKGYDSDEFRRKLRRRGSAVCIPPRSYRRIGTRYEKTDVCFIGFVQLAAIIDWLR